MKGVSMNSKQATSAARFEAPRISRATLIEVDAAGGLVVRTADARQFVCDWLNTGAWPELQPGDAVLTLEPSSLSRGLVLGRVGPYVVPSVAVIQAQQSLTLQCGESSLTLRADGKVMIKGEDVLLRAKGTQRIRAGNVAIN